MNLLYKSTRNSEKKVTASEAILKGLAEDGGLFVPEQIPTLDVTMEELKNRTRNTPIGRSATALPFSSALNFFSSTDVPLFLISLLSSLIKSMRAFQKILRLFENALILYHALSFNIRS